MIAQKGWSVPAPSIRTVLCRLILLALSCAGVSLTAQSRQAGASLPAATVDLQADRQMVTPVSQVWRFSGGDDPRWADPAFDDSAWKLLQPRTPWADQHLATVDYLAWVRFRLRLPAGMPALELLMPRFNKAYQIFADGQLAGQAGTLSPDKPVMVSQTPRIFSLPLNRARPIPGSETKEVVVAIRMWQDPKLVRIVSKAVSGNVYAGSPAAVESMFTLMKARTLLAFGNDYTQLIISLIVGVASLLLFLLTRRGFYAWFTASMLLGTLELPLHLVSQHFSWGYIASIYGYAVLDFLSVATYVLFVLAALNMRRWRLLAAMILLLVLAELGPVAFILGLISQLSADAIYFFASTIPDLVVLFFLVRGWRNRIPYARLLIFPFALGAVIGTSGSLGHFLVSLDVPHASLLLTANVEILNAPFAVSLLDIGNAVNNLALLAVLVYQFAQSSREEQRLKSALRTAHDIQQSLVPVDIPTLGGLHTEIVYLAAEEVGGDFCQVLPRPDSSILVVIGDVSGKGLQAAMVGTLVVGALRSMADEEIGPAETLSRLNNVLLRTPNRGFVTCLCMIITGTGKVMLANAGHLSPYLDGAEVTTVSELPLGCVPGIKYDQTTFHLPAAGRLTLLSDGVVEARSASGELYGFERTKKISSLLAREIATEANRFGQEDDITVITLDWQLPTMAMA